MPPSPRAVGRPQLFSTVVEQKHISKAVQTSRNYLKSPYSQIQERNISVYEPPSSISGTNRFKIGSKVMHHMKKSKVAAVVVTFNRKQLLLECLNALIHQTYRLDAIFIIDGPSTDGTPEALLDNSYINELPPEEHHGYSWSTTNAILRQDKGPLIRYIRTYDDIGGSGGFYEGVKYAYEEGYKWIWLMDDDAEPTKNALEDLIAYANLPNCIALASTVKNLTGEISEFHRGTFSLNRYFPSMQKPLDKEAYSKNEPVKIDFASFVGPLIKSDAISEVGYPNRNFFIHHDDVEYCLRLTKVGQLYLVPNSIIIHKEHSKTSNTSKNANNSRIKQRVPYTKLWRTYYGKRNLVYLGHTYSKNKVRFIIDLIKTWTLNIISITIFDDNKLNRIRFVTSAYLDGLQGTFDNNKPKRILYEGK